METISFARGVPAPDCLPVQELADCAKAAIEQAGGSVAAVEAVKRERKLPPKAKAAA